jgi:ketose-bisphosphate aldolase
MLYTLSEVLKTAQKNSYAVVAPDFFNLHFAQILLDCVEQKHAPMILSFCDSKYNTFELDDEVKCIHLVRELSVAASVPVVLHLDHAPSIEVIHKYLDLGFTSVMIDASLRPFEENVAITQKVMELARSYQASVEAELGHVGNGSDYLIHDPSDADLTNVEQVQDFVVKTKVDALAVSIGTQHGFYHASSELHFDLLERISTSTSVPLVLHGSSGTDYEQIKKAVSLGICKLNVFTDLFTVYQQATKKTRPVNLEEVYKLNETCRNEVYKMFNAFLEISGSIGRASDFATSLKQK